MGKLFLIPLLAIFPLFASRVIIDAEFVYLKRNENVKEICLVQVEDAPPANVAPGAVNTEHCPFGDCKVSGSEALESTKFTPGLRLTGNYLPNKRGTWQLSYLGLFDWDGNRYADCPGSLYLPMQDESTFDDYTDANRAQVHEESRLWSGELAYWGHLHGRHVSSFGISWMVGARYINFVETLDMEYYISNRKSNYDIKAWNGMGGIEFGFMLENQLSRNFAWGMRGKMGGLCNWTYQHTLWKDNNNTEIIANHEPRDFNFVFLGEFAPFITFNLFPRIAVRLSYEVLYLNQVALVINQVNTNTDFVNFTPAVNNNGHVLFHGLFVGVGLIF